MATTKTPLAVRSSQRQIESGHRASSLTHNDTTRTCGKQTVLAGNGRVVGAVRKGVFHKKVCASRHLLRKPEGWASDIFVLDQLEALGVEQIWLTDRESGKRYNATVGDFRRHGIPLDRGFGPQLVLPLRFWRTTQPGQAQVVQLSFGEVRP